MPQLRAECPSCNAILKTSNFSLSGKTVECPKCSESFVLPKLEAEADESEIEEHPRRSVRKKPRKAKADRANSKVRNRIVGGVFFALLVLLAIAWYSRSSSKPHPLRELAVAASKAKAIGPRTRFRPNLPAELWVDNDQQPAIDVLLLSANGKRMAISNNANVKRTVQIWDIESEPRKLSEYPGRLLAFSPDGKRFVRSNFEGTSFVTEIVEAETGRNLGTINYRGWQLFFRSPDRLICSSSIEQKGFRKKLVVEEYSAIDAKQKGFYTSEADDANIVNQATVNEGRELVFGDDRTNRIRVVDISSKTLVREIPLTIPTPKYRSWNGFHVSSDGKRLAIECNSAYYFIDGANGNVMAALPPSGLHSHWETFVPNRDVFLLACNVDKPYTVDALEVAAYDLEKKTIFATFRGHRANIRMIAVSANGQVMASADQESNILVWNLGELGK